MDKERLGLPMMQKAGAWLRNELKKLAPMTWRQRVEYIWGYYSWAILVTLAVLVVISSLISNYRLNSREVLISGIFINTTVDREGFDYVENDYWEYWGGSPRQRVELVESRYANYEDGSAYSSDAILTVEAMVVAKTLDYLIVDETTLRFLDEQNITMDLREVLTPEQLAMGDTIETEGRIIGLELSNTAFAKNYHLLPERAYLMVAACAQKPDRVSAFADYLLAEE